MTTKVRKNRIIGLKEFRLDTQKYIDALKKGESFIVVKRSQPVFKIIPHVEEWETLVDFSQTKKGGISAKKLLATLKK
jgi:antitoxin (DNA-binding transcriptional repressor) of toxin-antitoxin stability system